MGTVYPAVMGSGYPAVTATGVSSCGEQWISSCDGQWISSCDGHWGVQLFGHWGVQLWWAVCVQLWWAVVFQLCWALAVQLGDVQLRWALGCPAVEGTCYPAVMGSGYPAVVGAGLQRLRPIPATPLPQAIPSSAQAHAPVGTPQRGPHPRCEEQGRSCPGSSCSARCLRGARQQGYN